MFRGAQHWQFQDLPTRVCEDVAPTSLGSSPATLTSLPSYKWTFTPRAGLEHGHGCCRLLWTDCPGEFVMGKLFIFPSSLRSKKDTTGYIQISSMLRDMWNQWNPMHRRESSCKDMLKYTWTNGPCWKWFPDTSSWWLGCEMQQSTGLWWGDWREKESSSWQNVNWEWL